MSTLVTDLTHYLDVAPRPGTIRARTPAAKLGGFLGAIVEAVTAGFERGAAAYTTVPCRRRPGRKPCSGTICGLLEAEEGAIVWACSQCGDNGYIHRYQGTPWDFSWKKPLAQAEVGVLTRVAVTPDEYRCMRATVIPEEHVDRLLRSARAGMGTDEIIISGPRAWMDILYGGVSAALDDASTASEVFPLTSALGKLGRATTGTWQQVLDAADFGLYSTFETGGYALDDGEARHAAHPSAFWIPDRDDRGSLTPGQHVKLIFAIQEDPGEEVTFERMWVLVQARIGDLYVGRLDNDPVTSRTLAVGDAVYFGPEHVIDIGASVAEHV